MKVTESLDAQQIAYLRAHFPVDTIKSVADHLHITKYRVCQFARQLELEKDPESVSSRCSRQATMARSLERTSRSTGLRRVVGD